MIGIGANSGCAGDVSDAAESSVLSGAISKISVLSVCLCVFKRLSVCVTSARDLHVKRGHRGGLVDVTSLGVSVVDWHRRMEGREELWCSCIGREREEIFFSAFLLNFAKKHRFL